ncbi:MAG: O-antigen ligase family protein [Pseudolabrys sp.]|nr:O-antigen ligase family protein [Pseudolabrys sp.]
MSILSSNGRSALLLRLARYADAFAIGTAVALPWSKTLTSILLTLWLIALVPTLNLADVRREIATPAGGLPILLFALGLLGMAWTHASWPERLGGFDSFIKFLVLPLFFVQFRRSDGGIWVMFGYLASCVVLLAVSSILMVWPGGAFTANQEFGVPTGSAGAQCGEFAICSLALLFVSVEMFRRGRRRLAAGALALALAFLANIFFIVAANYQIFFVPFLPLVIIPLLVPLVFLKKPWAKAMISLLAAGAAACAVLWVSSSPENYSPWLGTRPLYWERSLTFISEAPVLGHGTGAMPQLFARAAAGQTGMLGHVTTNPHQQTFAVGIQVGLVGIVLLWSMWIAHLLFFRGNTLPEWIGFVVVTQSIVGSMSDSHLFDSSQGWTYVFAVGVAGGMVRRLRAEHQSLQRARIEGEPLNGR